MTLTYIPEHRTSVKGGQIVKEILISRDAAMDINGTLMDVTDILNELLASQPATARILTRRLNSAIATLACGVLK